MINEEPSKVFQKLIVDLFILIFDLLLYFFIRLRLLCICAYKRQKLRGEVRVRSEKIEQRSHIGVETIFQLEFLESLGGIQGWV